MSPQTIIFAKNHKHAEFIADRFNANYPHYKGEFARVIDFEVKYAQSLIDDFSNPAKAPHIAISVDMLDTGIDIPEIVNLVFFKLVRSKTKFWQMVGRGTRLRPDLFGPGKNKKLFYVFDYCQNLEFFSQNPETVDGASGESLGKRLFTARVELIAALSGPHHSPSTDEQDAELRKDTASFLHGEVAAMNVNNFIVRPKRWLVEKYGRAEAWENLRLEERAELVHEVAGLPSEQTDDYQEAKEFDYLMLRLQLAVLRANLELLNNDEQVVVSRSIRMRAALEDTPPSPAKAIVTIPLFVVVQDSMAVLTQTGGRLPAVGEVAFGRYRILAPVELGEMGVVYRAYDEHSQHEVKIRITDSSDVSEVEPAGTEVTPEKPSFEELARGIPGVFTKVFGSAAQVSEAQDRSPAGAESGEATQMFEGPRRTRSSTRAAEPRGAVVGAHRPQELKIRNPGEAKVQSRRWLLWTGTLALMLAIAAPLYEFIHNRLAMAPSRMTHTMPGLARPLSTIAAQPA